jgi:hypothetical protein
MGAAAAGRLVIASFMVAPSAASERCTLPYTERRRRQKEE